MSLVWIALGFVLLVAGGRAVVSGSVAIANRLGVSPLVVGLVIVGFGTSAPELVTGIKAALEGVPRLSYGNAIGASLANLLLVLGVAALITPVVPRPEAVRRDALAMLGAFGAVLAVSFAGLPPQASGIALVLALVAFVALTLRAEARRRVPPAEIELRKEEAAELGPPPGLSAALAAGLVAGGIVGLVVGADLLVEGAVTLARGLGVSEAVIGLTVVAIGTCLPELVTGVVAAREKHTEVIVGNVLGSCLFNMLAVVGVVLAISGVAIDGAIRNIDAVVLTAVGLGVTALLLAGGGLRRPAGFFALAGYVTYLGVRATVLA